jgi:ABC-type bacteriocin/lantibiotic exporter with double-glycine peptidase domain
MVRRRCILLIKFSTSNLGTLESAEVENNMNSVERVVHYATEIEQEAPYELPEKKPKGPWPSKGKVELKDVVLHYRPELPAVLKGTAKSLNSYSY